jgi:hypothetical protein
MWKKNYERNVKQGKPREDYPVLLGDPQLLQIRNSFEYFRPRGREEEAEDDDDEGRNWLLLRDVRFKLPAHQRRERRGGGS